MIYNAASPAHVRGVERGPCPPNAMLKKTYKFLASLKLAVILLVSLCIILALATWLESKYDAKTAAHLVYGSWWFYLFLFMLGVNVLFAALVRYPWKRHQAAFVIVHLGIIVVLLGSFITRFWGLEGTMQLLEGQQSSAITVDQSMIAMQPLKMGEKGVERGETRGVPVEFRWSPPTAGHPARVTLGEGLTAVVDRYIHNAQPIDLFVPATSNPSAPPALHVELAAGKGAPMPEGTIMAEPWLVPDDPEHQEARMGPATVRVIKVTTKEALDRALAPKTDAKLDASDGLLTVEADGHSQTIAVAGNHGREVAVEGTPYRIRIDSFLPFAVVDDKTKTLVSRSDERNNPAVQLTVLDEKGEAEKQVLFAKFPDFNTAHKKERPLKVKIGYAMEDVRTSANALVFVIGPDDALYVRIDSAAGPSRSEKVEMGKANPTGWRMNFMYTVRDLIAHAAPSREYKPFKASRGMMGGGGGMPPAIHFTVEGADSPGPYWLGQGDGVTVTRSQGNQAARISYQLEQRDIGFLVKLLDFTVGYDPGTRNAATYTSKVNVDDAAHDKRFDAIITMNEPLDYNGLTFFQASFGQGEGGAQMSVFSVARDPGVPVKYFGSILLIFGIGLYVFARQPRNRSQAGAAVQKKSKKSGRSA